MPSFPELVKAINITKKVKPFYGKLLALDPGETTGFATFIGSERTVHWEEIDQIKTWPMAETVAWLEALFNQQMPHTVVMESYRVYDWKSDDHKWSPVNTVQVIGCIQTLCIQRGIPYYFQSAQIAKNFFTDEKLREYGMYLKGVRHGRDATRHGAYFLCFGPPSNS